MGGFRAKDADRERYVEVIEAAYVDGQLGAQDRELRVGRALTAETLDELHALTRDLQDQPAAVVVRPSPAAAVVEPPVAPPVPVGSSSTSGVPATVTGLVAAVVFIAVVLGMASSAQDDMGTFSQDQQYAVPWDESSDRMQRPGYQLSVSAVASFVRRYEAKFGTTETHEVGFFPSVVRVEVPARGARQRVQVWTWDGSWGRDTSAQPSDAPAGVVDLRTIDVRTLFDNVDVATQDLGASDARVARVVVRPSPDGRGSVSIHVRDDSGGGAQLETTAQGSRIRSVPFEA